MSNAVLHGGQHATEFTVLTGWHMMFGVVRSDWDVGSKKVAHSVPGHRFYYTHDGTTHPGNVSWHGMLPAWTASDRIGLLLDLEAGSLRLFNQDRGGMYLNG